MQCWLVSQNLLNEVDLLEFKGCWEEGRKVKEVAKWVRQKQIQLTGLIETMRNDFPLRRIWGIDDYKWAFVEAQGRSRGILCI